VEPDLALPAAPAGRARFRRRGKRLFDILVAAACLLVLAPVLLAVAALVRLTSPGPALFRQTRIGQHGRPFRMYKFRTMTAGCSDQLHREYVTGLLLDEAPRPGGRSGLYKLEADPRVTRLGALLRRTSIDELPQLLNVLRGEMSVVGPRPMLPWELELVTPPYRERLAVPAGITGLWQVSGRNKLTMKEGLELDIEYVRTATFLLDLLIVARTVLAVLLPRGGAR
jgi:lipopolysaccharide/colanic/teichoic acid biosynthesis glycosyltransferase